MSLAKGLALSCILTTDRQMLRAVERWTIRAVQISAASADSKDFATSSTAILAKPKKSTSQSGTLTGGWAALLRTANLLTRRGIYKRPTRLLINGIVAVT